MPYEIEYDPANSCMMCRLTGSIDQRLVMEFATALVPLMEEHDCVRVLNDLRGADLALSYFDLYKVPKVASLLNMNRLARRAVVLLFQGKVEMVETADSLKIRTVNKAYDVPSVVRLWQYRRVPYKRIMLTRKNVLARDSNQCQYCVIAHGAILRIRARNPHIADQLASNYRKADISERQRAMLDFALKVSRQAETVNESDYEKLNALGFDDEDIWDIGAISAFFGLSNRIVNLSSMRTNDEFYLMGRVPREK